MSPGSSSKTFLKVLIFICMFLIFLVTFFIFVVITQSNATMHNIKRIKDLEQRVESLEKNMGW